MTTKTYYSPFFPNVQEIGAKGSTIAAVPSASISTIRDDLDKALEDVQKLVDGAGADVTPPGAPTNLTASSTLTDAGSTLTASWSPPASNDHVGFDFAIREGNGSFIEFVTTGTTFERQALPRNREYSMRVRAFDRAGNRGAWTGILTYTTVRDLIAPAPPTNVSVATAYSTANIVWLNSLDADLDSVEIALHNSANVAIDSRIVKVARNSASSVIWTELQKATTYRVKLASIDTSGNNSAQTAFTSFTTAGNIDVTLIAPNAIKASQLGVNFGGGNLVRNSSFEETYAMGHGPMAKGFALYDNSYPNDGSSTDIQDAGRRGGKALLVQWAKNTTTKGFYLVNSGHAPTSNDLIFKPLTTYIVSFYAKGAGSATLNSIGLRWNTPPVETVELNNPFVSGEWQRYAYRIRWAADVDTQGFVTTNYAGNTAGYIYFDDIQIEEGEYLTAYTPAFLPGEVTGPLIALNAITETKISDSAVSTRNLIADAVTANKLAVDAVVARNIATDAIVARHIASQVITADEIASDAIVARVLAIGNYNNVIPDGNFKDVGFWHNYTGDARFEVVGDIGLTGYARSLKISPNGAIDTQSAGFTMEPGATYKISYTVYNGLNFSGYFTPMLHVHGQNYVPLKTGIAFNPPIPANDTTDFRYAGQINSGSFIWTNGGAISQRVWTIRYMGSWTGDAYLAMSIVRVSDNTLIKDGAITTDKITVGTLNGDRITVGTLDANKIKANTILAESVTVGVGGSNLGNIRDQAQGSNSLEMSDYLGTNLHQITNKSVVQVAGTSAWRNNLYSYRMIKGACVVTGRLITPDTFMGLSDGRENLAVNDFETMDYAFHRSTNGNLYTYLNGVGTIFATSAAYPPYIPFSIIYDGRTIRFYAENVLIREVDIGPNRIFSAATSTFSIGASIDGLSFETYSDNSLARADPALRINEYTTKIEPGKITISGTTTLSDWRQGGDVTMIAGGSISANTITANKLKIGNRGINVEGIDFSWNPANNVLSWTSGRISYVNDANNPDVRAINPGAQGWDPSWTTIVIYWNKGAGVLYAAADNMNGVLADPNNVVMCTWNNGRNFLANYGGTIIDGDRITTGTINADRIKANTVLATTIIVGTDTLGKLNGIAPNATNTTNTNQLTDGASLGLTAAWGNVSNNNGLRPADGATVGAPVGTLVGSTAAGTVESNASTGARDPTARINEGVTTIDGGKITAYSITAQQITTGQLITLSAQIGDLVVTNAKIANLSVDSLKIAGQAVTTTKMAPSAVQQVAFQTLTYSVYVPRS